MRLLDLFCGAGGAAVGYSRADFTEIVGVDNRPQKRYPFTFVLGDALEYVREHGREFDAIHASPPCQAYTALAVMPYAKGGPDLLGAVIAACRGYRFVVENVPGAPWPLDVYRTMLCGSSFGLRVRRHRWFACSELILAPPCDHDQCADVVGVYGASDGAHPAGFKHPGIRRGPRQATTEEARMVMEMPWAIERRGLTEAIPPAYTEFIGRQLLQGLSNSPASRRGSP